MPGATTVSRYTIVDVGAPSPALYTAPSADAFNNAGQIVGTAVSVTAKRTDCFLYAGDGRFSPISGGSGGGDCFPFAISNPDAAQTVRIVGTFSSTYAAPHAFYAVVNASGTTLSALAQNVPSELTGVNSAGKAVGDAYYRPAGGFFSTSPMFESAAGPTIVVAQQQCTSYRLFCALNVPDNRYACSFGGCQINDAGTILGFDAQSGHLLTRTFGEPMSGRHLPIVAAPATALVNGELINDADQIAYSVIATAPPNRISSYVYSIAHETTTPIPTLKGSSCAQSVLISLTNTGEVLGLAQQCANSKDNVYFIWDPVRGTRNLSALIPSDPQYSAIFPVGENDKGQFLLNLTLKSGAVHWGILEPANSVSAVGVRKAVEK